MESDNTASEQNLQVAPDAIVSNNETRNDSIDWLPLSSTKTEHKPGVYTYNFKQEQHRWIRLHYLTRQKAYSNSAFKDGHRLIENVTAVGNIIIFDIDDGYTLDEVKVLLKKYHHLIVTTSNHQKDKKGLVCDRFRVLMVADEDLPIDNDVHKRFMPLLAETIGLDPMNLDKNCFNTATAYKPSQTQSHWYNEGSVVLVGNTISLAKGLIEAEKTIQAYTPVKEYSEDKQVIIDALHRIDPDVPYSDWFRIGAALKTVFGEDGLAHFDDWSSKGSGYNERSVQHKWRQFTSGKVGPGTIIRMAS